MIVQISTKLIHNVIGTETTGKLFLVDLAGSERVG